MHKLELHDISLQLSVQILHGHHTTNYVDTKTLNYVDTNYLSGGS